MMPFVDTPKISVTGTSWLRACKTYVLYVGETFQLCTFILGLIVAL